MKLIAKTSRDFIEEKKLYGCVLPRGRVRVIATAEEGETHGIGYSVLSVAGRFVAVATNSGNQYSSSSGGYVADVKTGDTYTLASSSCRIDEQMCPPAMAVDRLFLTSDGRSAAALIAGNAITTIAVFTPTGARTDLDSGPNAQVQARTLQLAGETVSWTGTGGPRNAQLPPP